MHLFTYGTLMHPEIMNDVVKGAYAFEVIEIQGFERRALKDRAYPGLIRNEKAKVTGVLYKDISESDMGLLDHFEGEEYTRIEILKMNELPVFTYLFTWDKEIILNESWSYEEFQGVNFHRFRNEYKGWKK